MRITKSHYGDGVMETVMRYLDYLIAIIIWPGDKFCRVVGQKPREDSGMLRGFVNNIVWGFVCVVILWYAI
ncbi:MAG: hypothetical protein ACPGGK_08985 [Pikeienuella sp.]